MFSQSGSFNLPIRGAQKTSSLGAP